MMQIVATGRDGVATIFKTIYLCVSVNADWQAEALCSHVVRLSVRPLPHLWTRGFENEFCHMVHRGQERETISFGIWRSHEKIELETSTPLGRASFLLFW